MKIETKYNIGQEVWYSMGGHTYHNKVIGIHILKKDIIMYDIRFAHTHCTLEESVVFSTKEELLKSVEHGK